MSTVGVIAPLDDVDALLGASNYINLAQNVLATVAFWLLMQATLTDGAVVGRGVSTKLPLGVEIGAHVADVEVDTDTGLVTVLRYTAFQDVRRRVGN